MAKTTHSESPSSPGEIMLRLLASLLKELGLPSFVILFLAFFMVIVASDAQKELFISKWILLESHNHSYCILIVLFLILTSVTGGIYLRKMHKLTKQELDRVSNERSRLQEKLLNSPTLSSTNMTKKSK